MAHSLPVFPKFEVNGDSASTGHSKLINLFMATNIDSHKRTKALPLHYAGDEVFEINGTLDNTGDENDFDEKTTRSHQLFQIKSYHRILNIHISSDETVEVRNMR